MAAKARGDRVTAEQRAAALTAVRADPGTTAYRVSLHLPMPEAAPGELIRKHFPMTLMLAILADLRADGLIRSVPNPRGQQFYPIEQLAGKEIDPDDNSIPF
jgi:hypothetical protein